MKSYVDVANTSMKSYVDTNKVDKTGGTISGDINLTGNLTVTGTTFYANVTNVTIEDNVLTLNSNVTGVPTQNAGIEVNRGSSSNVSVLWNETDKSWEFTNDGTNYDKVAGLNYANSAYAHSNAAYNSANTNASVISVIQGVDDTQNTNISSADSKAQSAYDTANTKLNISGGEITGSLTVDGQANVYQRLSVGTGAYTILPNLISQFTGNSDYYSQINQQNLSGKGSADMVVTADNGTDMVNYIDMGITGSTYDNSTPNAFPTSNPNDGYLYLVGNPGSDFGGNLVIGTSGSGSFADISIVQGVGYDETARFKLGQGLTINTNTPSTSISSGALVVQGGVGVSGDVYAGGVYDNGVRVKSYVDTANTFLQSNDASTLVTAKSYTDSANTSLKSYVDTANTSMKSYVDGQVVNLNSNISANLATAEGYTDTANTKMKSYVDGINLSLQGEISANLATAESYTDTANTFNQSYTNAANTSLKSYVDDQVVTINSNISANLSTAEGYTDTANTKMKSYVDVANTSMKSYVDNTVSTANTSLKSYVDGQVVTLNSNISANLATAEGYTDTANTKMKSYVDVANTSMKSYVDVINTNVQGEISANLATAKSYTDTSNTFNQTYTNNANTALKSYVDGQVVTLNSNISANLTTAEGYTDTANTKLKSYVDNTMYVKTGGTISGAVSISDVTQSTGTSTGALTVAGGVGITKNLNVGGNAIISGDLTVQGTQYITSTDTLSYSNPTILLHTPSTGYLVTNDGYDIGINYEYYSSTTSGPRIVTGGSGNGTTATINISDGTYYPPGSVVEIRGVTPSGFNGVYLTTAATIGSFSFASTTTGTIDTSGSYGVTRRITEVVTLSGSSAGGYANVSFDSSASGVTFAVGQTVSLTGITPSNYNGSYTITSSGPGWIQYNVSGNPSNITVNGRLVISQRHAFSGFANDSSAFEFYRVGDMTPSNTFAGLYGTIKAGQFLVSPNFAEKGSDIQGGFFKFSDAGVCDTTTQTSGTLTYPIGASFGQLTYSAANTGVVYQEPTTIYIAGAPQNGNNVTFSGNTWALWLDQGNARFDSNVVFTHHNSNDTGITFADGTHQTTNAATYAYSTASYAQSNTATNIGQSAYNTANTNASNIAVLQAVNLTQNNSISVIQAVDLTQNTNISAADTKAQSGFDKANTTYTYAQAGYAQANTSASAISVIQAVDLTQNTNITSATNTAQAGFDKANTTLTYAQAGYAQGNTSAAAITVIQGVDLTQNTNITNVTNTAQAAYNSGNSTYSYAQSAYAQANTSASAISVIQSVDLTQNTNITSATNTAQAGFDKANAVYTYAQAGYAQGNTSASAITVIQAVDNTQNTNITSATNTAQAAFDKANTDVTTISTTAGIYGGTTAIPVITLEANGRVSAITNTSITVPPGTSIYANTGQLTANASTGTVALGLATTSVTAGTYSYPMIQVDAYGRTVSISNQTPVISFNGMTGAVSLSSANVVSALGYTPFNSAGGTISGDTIFSGNLTVNGTTTTINATTLTVDDINIELGSIASPTDVTAAGGGITLKGTTDKTITWGSTNGWTSSEDINVASGKIYRINGTSVLSATTLGSGVTASSLTSVGTLTNLTVTNTITGSVSGSAGSVAASALTGTTLASGVTGSSLTSVGTIGTGVWNAGAVTSSGGVQGTTLTSTVATGTAPLTVTSTTKVTNLNVDQVDGYHPDPLNTASSIVVRDASKNIAVSGVVLSGSTSGTSTLVASAAAGTTTFTLPTTTGTIITTGDTGTVTNTMLAGSIATSKITGLATSATTDTTNASNITSGTLAAVRLATSGVTAGTYGGSANIPVVTVDAYGRLTSVSNTSIVTGTTLVDEVASVSTYYPLLTTSTTGSISSANTSSTKLSYVPSTGTLTTVDLNTTSDAQYKENVETILDPMIILNNINGVSFNWKDSGNKSYGVIAQELQKVLPELVKQGDQGLSVSYIPLIAILIQAVKEQQKQINELKQK
jgi:hypothetical protein